MNLSKIDYEELSFAKDLLETISLATRLNDIIGVPISKGFELLPDKWNEIVQTSAEVALRKALAFSITSLGDSSRVPASNLRHKIVTATSGALAGTLGIAALSVELPISTIVMLRSIADIARSEGANFNTPETKLACIEVFALGGYSTDSDGVEQNYYMTRAALAKAMTEATDFLATRGFVEGSSAMLRLISAIASRFGVAVSEKIAMTALPLIGAASGAVINTIFMDHFQTMAQGHFIVKRLEAQYGQDTIKLEYQRL